MRRKWTLFYRNPFVVLAFFMLVLLAGRMFWYDHYMPPEHPRVVQGVLDMRGWDFEHSRMIPLEGEWMSPRPSTPHQSVSGELAFILKQSCKTDYVIFDAPGNDCVDAIKPVNHNAVISALWFCFFADRIAQCLIVGFRAARKRLSGVPRLIAS